MWRPTATLRSRSPASARDARRRDQGRRLSRALPRQSREPRPEHPTRSPSRRCARRSRRAAAIGAEGVIFHVGSHLGAGFWRPARASRAGTPRAARADDRRPLAADGELGRSRRHDRPLDRRARRAVRRASTGTRGSASASTRATGASPASTSPTPPCSTRRSPTSTTRIGLDRLRCLHVNDAKARSARIVDRHASVGVGEMNGRARDVPRPPGLPRRSPRSSRPPDRRRQPDAAELRLLRDAPAHG